MEARDFEAFGAQMGHIVVDLFYINPYDGEEIWSEDNSELVISTGSTQASKKVPSSFYTELKVTDVAGFALKSMLLQGKRSRKEAIDSVIGESAD